RLHQGRQPHRPVPHPGPVQRRSHPHLLRPLHLVEQILPMPCHPENPHVWAPSCAKHKMGQRGEGSAVRTEPTQRFLNRRVPHPSRVSASSAMGGESTNPSAPLSF